MSIGSFQTPGVTLVYDVKRYTCKKNPFQRPEKIHFNLKVLDVGSLQDKTGKLHNLSSYL